MPTTAPANPLHVPDDKVVAIPLTSPKLSETERLATQYAARIRSHIDLRRGRYLRDESGSLHILLHGTRIPITFDRDNRRLAELVLNSCGVSTLGRSAQAAIQRLQVHADSVSGKVRMRRFSALSDDRERLYIPTVHDPLLVTANEIRTVANGDNQDSLWLEHPSNAPLIWTPDAPTSGLLDFERLLVDNQACRVPELRWLVAMHEGLFPFVRDITPARFILEHIGPTQSGKTTGATRFTLLHGLEVRGDYTVAALGNLGDCGLLVMDNKEQTNFTQPLIDYVLFLATGAERARSLTDGNLRLSSYRPVGVITSIEGVAKAELRARVVEVQYAISGGKLRRGPIEDEIRDRRHEILSALVPVLQRWLRIRHEGRQFPNPVPEFEENFTTLCQLLQAFGEVAGRPSEWADGIISAWGRVLGSREIEEDEIEHAVLRVLEEDPTGEIGKLPLTHGGMRGSLYVCGCGALLTGLQQLGLRNLMIPHTPEGLSRRLRGGTFRTFRILDHRSAPELDILKRRAGTRPIGVFVPDDDGMTVDDSSQTRTVIA